MEPVPETTDDQLEMFGVSLALNKASRDFPMGGLVAEEIPHVRLVDGNKWVLELDNDNSCDQQKEKLEELYPSGRIMNLHRTAFDEATD